MGQPLSESIEDWAGGAIDTLEPDAIPSNASPRAWNTALTSAAGGKAAVSKRKGCSIVNVTAIAGSPAIIGQQEFKRRSGSSYTTYHLLVTDTGKLEKNVAGTVSNIGTPFTSGTNIPSFAVANNLCFITNGVENKKFDGTNIQAFGIATPTVAPTIADPAIAGGTVSVGPWEARYTYYNSATGHESSTSPTSNQLTLGAINRKIRFTWTASGDSQVTHVKLYARNTTTMTTFRLVNTIAIGVVTSDETIVETTLITAGPDTAENDPPPVMSVIAFHRNRMFGVKASAPSMVVYSKLNLPEAFDPDFFFDVGVDDGKSITALVSLPDYLLIAKRDSLWGLFGDDPNTWELRLLDPSIGVTSSRGVVTQEGNTYFWSEQGPMTLAGVDAAVPIGRTLIADTLASDNLRFSQSHMVCAGIEQERDRVLFAVNEASPEGETGQTRNNIILPYNYRLQRWESHKWNPLDVASFGVIEDANSIPQVYIGGYKGRLFQWWSGDTDGVPTTSTMSGTVTSATSTTLTDSGASFYTTGSGLTDLYVYVTTYDGLTTQRRRIGSNTGTVLTLDTSLTWATTPNTTFTYVIAGPDFQFDTHWNFFQLPFVKKRLEFAYVGMKASASASAITVKVDLMRNMGETPVATYSFAISQTGAIWDSSLWDDSEWGTSSGAAVRLRLAKTAWAWRLRFRNRMPNQPLILLRLSVSGEALTDKLG